MKLNSITQWKHRSKSILAASAFLLPGLLQADSSYLVLSTEETLKDPAWKKVADALVEKHDAEVSTFTTGDPASSLDILKKMHPRHVCLVARPDEVSVEFVVAVHQVMRKIDDDPYADAFWGIVTGFDAENALAIAKHNEPLTIKRVASGTEVALEKCVEGVWYCELNKNRMVRKKPNGEPEKGKGPDDTTKVLVDTLNDYKPDLFVTSGHATERDWMIGFRYSNGYFRSKAGHIVGDDTKGEKFEINSPNPKVYMPIGNCLMGHIDGPDAMALGWLNCVGVKQMLGYIIPTWYGYAGWGVLDYFVEQPGKYTFTEAFFANQHALIHRLDTNFTELATAQLTHPNGSRKFGAKVALTEGAKERGVSPSDGIGLLFDRDSLVFYGDPAWNAKMADGENSFGQTLEKTGDNIWTFTITPQAGKDSFKPVNMNGSQRGGRPIVAYFPERLKGLKVIEGGDLKPVLTDDFILVPNPMNYDSSRKYVVKFEGEKVSK